MAAGQDIDKKDKISTNGYYFEMGVAQVSSVTVYIIILINLFMLHINNVKINQKMYYQ